MFDSLSVINIPVGGDLPKLDSRYFVLNTCQRHLIIGMDDHPVEFLHVKGVSFQSFKAAEAYRFLLEVICGLHSHLVGENEIVGQFRQGLKDYFALENRDNHVCKVLEKLLQDNKYLRTNFMLGIGQKTYALIAKTFILSRKMVDRVLILGAGQLAVDLINQFRKRIPVMVSARNIEKLAELAQTYEVEILPWMDLESYAATPHIINTIGATETILDKQFLSNWKAQTYHNRLLVDLGVPSPISILDDAEDDIIRLKQIFEEGQTRDLEKAEKIEAVKGAIAQRCHLRMDLFRAQELKQIHLSSQSM